MLSVYISYDDGVTYRIHSLHEEEIDALRELFLTEIMDVFGNPDGYLLDHHGEMVSSMEMPYDMIEQPESGKHCYLHSL